MFKKLKDKIAEEVKQSPLKFQTSVQQFTQSVSPSLSFTNSTTGDVNATLVDEKDEADESHNFGDYDNSFTTVELRSSMTPKARRSSSSSVNSDLFPVYEFPRQLTMQSDLESCSEFDDGSSIHQFNNVTKENLYEKYRTALQKYHKYRGRFSDLQNFCKELQRELNKAKNVLTETQDKAIRRIAELKEQCALEQKAKAHLEDTWRNELEEREHLINTLNTKIELLKSGKNYDDEEVPIITFQTNANEDSSSSEADILKEKIKKFESLLNNAKDAITSKTAQIKDLSAKAESDKNKLKLAEDRIAKLEENIALMKRKDEEAHLSLAENKLHVHQELEAKESQIKMLEKKITELKEEIKKLRVAKSHSEKLSEINETCSVTKNTDYEALKREIELLTAAKVTDQNTIAQKDRLIREFKTAVDTSNQELLKLRNEMEATSLFSRIEDADLKNVLKQTQATAKQLESSLTEKQREFETTIQQLTVAKEHLEQKVQNLEQELSVVKTDSLEKGARCECLEDELTTVTNQLDVCRKNIAGKEVVLKEKLNEVQRLTSELTNANAKIKEYTNEKKIWTETETHLKADKIVLEEQIKLVRKELNNAQAELKDARNAVSEREKDANEKKKLEKRLADKENESAQLKIELEHEMLVRTASLMEEINSLKTKQDSHLSEIRKLKADVRNLQDKLKEMEVSKKKVEELNESLTIQIEQLKLDVSDKRKIESESSSLRNDLNVSRRENDALKNEVSRLNNELECMKQSNLQMNDIKLEIDTLQQELREANTTKENLQSEKDNLQTEIERLRNEYDELTKELAGIRSTNTTDQKRNDELMRDLQSEQKKLSSEYKIVEDKVIEIENEKDQFLKQIDILKIELAEEKTKHQLLLSTADAYEELKEEYYRTQQYVQDFLKDLKPVLENCLELKECIVRKHKANEELTRQTAVHVETIKRLEAQLKHSREENIASSKRDLLSSLGKQAASLKNEYVRVKSEVVAELNSLKQYCQECHVKVSNGPVKIIQRHTNYVSELEDRLSTVEPLCESLKCRALESENENRQLLDKIEQFSSNAPNIADESLLRNMEEDYASKIKIVVTDYENKLLEKERMFEELQDNILAKDRAQIAAMSNETKEILQTMEEDLALKQDALEKLLENQKDEVDKFNKEISELKEEHVKELREIDKRWRTCLDKKVQEVEDKYKEEINELTKEWSTDRKQAMFTDISQSAVRIEDGEQTLEKYALRNENAEALKKQVEILSSELNNYKKSHWKNIELDICRSSDNSELSLEDCTELEYLRNILFEYMMGHQPLVLAKVLAAVVKFDTKQTQQVLQREEQKLTLLGHIGLT